MPECKRCGRVAATAELRRTPGGNYVCKTDRERCTIRARAGDWPTGIDELARDAMKTADAMVTACNREDAMRALHQLGRMKTLYGDLALEVAMRASREGHTQKEIATALGVPASSLRGLKTHAA